MNYEIVACSPKAERKIQSRIDMIGIESELPVQTKYPFGKLGIGQAFAVPFAETTDGAIRAQASYHSRGEKQFIVVKHVEHQCYEAARIA